MFRMVADKLILKLAEKNSFLCRCIGLLSNLSQSENFIRARE